ncbi:MAG TPA: NAD+ kinase [Candidatus Angelobacter sp.]|nr:NAD+ kinase [Candidatus Angelobacter sp.]
MRNSPQSGARRVGLEKIVLVTRKTRLAELIERFNTLGQARFYIEHSGGNFLEYTAEDDAYRRSIEVAHRSIELGLKLQEIDRSLVPTYTFLPADLVITLGQDGLVANTAKYVGAQPIIGVNPDPVRFDGILLPFAPDQLNDTIHRVLDGSCRIRAVTLAEAKLNDGQRLLAFNDFFLGAQTHVSARYRIRYGKLEESQSSSGVLVSTGAGSTGWMSSVFNMAAGVATFAGGHGPHSIRLDWEDRRLLFVVREPFVSRHSQANVIAGFLEQKQTLILESQMPSGGAIFSDGIEADFLQFNSGSTVTVGTAAESAHLVVG